MGPWRRGSASRSQREGRGFESRRLHQTVPPVARLTRHPCGQTLIMHWKKRWEGPSRPDFFPARAGVFPGRRFESGSRLSGSVDRVFRPEGRAAARMASWTPPFASVVQWQARRSPKPSIRVRVPAGVRRRHPPFGPSGLRLRGRMATVSECGAVGSARGWGPRGRGFESRHSDVGKPNKTELARMRAKYAAWLERDRRLSRRRVHPRT